MNGLDKPLIRAAGLIILVVMSVVALRGYLPATNAVPPPLRRPDESRSLGVQLLLCGVLALLILLSLRRRHRRPAPSSDGPSYLRLRGLTRREVIIAVATVLALLGVVWTLLYATRPTGEGPAREPGGGTAEPRQPERTEPRSPGKREAQNEPDTALLILGAVLVGMAVVVLVLKRRAPDVDLGSTEQSADSAETTSGSLAHLVELGLAEVAEPGRDPRASIIACYAAMEQGLTTAPDAAPLASDTPSEVLQRAIHLGALQSRAGTQLVALFSEARFSPHQMTQTDRESATQCLQTVLDDLRSRP
ncbi:DUF4129 domain-containing protein [Mycobacterium sp. CBMA271]|uniref:DUF4129 domain-containing protein n=1 Tax=unclassified Mycobacteroides TaxID=2618759 RepID=UPI0012DEDFF9|nr:MULTISPECIES: DUF4129 domain-containing protein [unclassified Mycobacteroides]MUM15980.1 hypothetical protein [Mycobacteroides sp. CBMA 326]MUM22521.1 DUF4129 domain-containing protein [Mycobacteroides sp. CBMA 271]